MHFFHDTVADTTCLSCESPDVCCHEMGHAVLDSICPQLFDAQTIEAAAFHESFGDISAILSTLQVGSLRTAVLSETGGVLNRSSRLSRLAEQLGGAIRVQHPDQVDSDCLRNAANSFFYRDPQTLPPTAPASALSSEPHSFSRVFTAGFVDALAGIVRLQRTSPSADDLQKVSQQVAETLVSAILTAPVVPDYYSQVAVHMVASAQTGGFDAKYKDIIRSAFVRRGILSLQAAVTISHAMLHAVGKAAMAAPRAPPTAALPKSKYRGGELRAQPPVAACTHSRGSEAIRSHVGGADDGSGRAAIAPKCRGILSRGSVPARTGSCGQIRTSRRWRDRPPQISYTHGSRRERRTSLETTGL